MDKAKVIEKFNKSLKLSKRGLSAQYNNSTSCWSFYNGDQMTYQDKIQFEDGVGRKRLAQVSFNKVQPNVDSVVGFMAQNRRQAKYIARVQNSQAQQLYSKYMNSIFSYHRENTNADQLETAQDADMMVIGYGAIETDLSYVVGNATSLPNGEILKRRVTQSVGWDSKAREPNIIDARWVYYYDDFELRDALELFQGSTEEDFDPVSQTDNEGGYTYNPWGGLYDKIKLDNSVEWSAQEENMVRVYNFQWFEFETFYKAKNPIYSMTDPMDRMFALNRLVEIAEEQDTNEIGGVDVKDGFEFDPEAEELTIREDLKGKIKKEFGNLITLIPFKRKVFYTAVISGKHCFKFFKSVSQQGYSVKFKTGIFFFNSSIVSSKLIYPPRLLR